MKYDFDQSMDCSRNFSAKYDECAGKFGREGLIPLWIADMDQREQGWRWMMGAA